MKEHATFATGVVVAIAAAIVVPAIWQGSPIAWAATAVLLLVVVISIAMYLSKRLKESTTPDEDTTMSAAPSPITVELISAHDQSIAARNKVRSTINFYNPPPPAQSAPLKDTDISDS